MWQIFLLLGGAIQLISPATCNLFEGNFKTETIPGKIIYSLSPIYMARLALREVQVYELLKNSFHIVERSVENPLLQSYLEDYDDSVRQGGIGQWEVFEHPNLIFRMIYRFVYYLNPIILEMTRGGVPDEVTLAEKLKELDDVGYPKDDDIMLPSVISMMVNIQHVFDFPASEMSVGKFGTIETGVRLSPSQMMVFANVTYRLDFFVQAKDWLDLLEREYLNEVDAGVLQMVQKDLIKYHDLGFKNKSDGGDLYVFTQHLSSGVSETFKHKETRDWIQYGEPSGLQRERMAKVSALCSNSSLLEAKGRLVKSKRMLRCWSDRRKHPYFTISPLKTEQLSRSPHIYMYHDFLGDREIHVLESMSTKDFMQQAKDSWENQVPGQGRISFSWIEKEEIPSELNLVQKLETTLGLEIDGDASDAIRMSLYHLGGDGVVHQDAYRAPNLNATTLFADRISTILIYMNEVKLGGETVFPDLDLVVKPVRGSLLFWDNYHSDGKVDWRTYHAPCPAVLGYKLFATTFVDIKYNMFTRPCGLRQRRQEGYTYL